MAIPTPTRSHSVLVSNCVLFSIKTSRRACNVIGVGKRVYPATLLCQPGCGVYHDARPRTTHFHQESDA
jgi:hypothetical protein